MPEETTTATQTTETIVDKHEPNLTKVIEDAATKVAIDVGKDIEKEEKVETKEEKIETKEEKEVEDLNAEQLTFAKTLYKALNNPDQAIQRQTLEILAKAANLQLNEIETKKDVVEAKDALLDLLKSHLGEYDFLADKLAPVLKTAIKDVVDENTKDIRETQKQEQKIRYETQINDAIDKAFATYSNGLEVKDIVLRKMDDFKIGPKMTYQQYFKSLIVLAAEEKGIQLKLANTKASETTDKKIERNRQDAHSRLASDRTSEVKEIARNPRERRKLDLVINDALEQVSKEINTR